MTTVSTTTYHVSRDVWEHMLVDIESAETSIDFESYIFVADEIGRRFIERLLHRAHEGVKVRMLLDMVGSFSFYQSDIPAELRRKGIEVLFFNPISLWRIHDTTSYFFRDHRKLLIIDNKIGYTGGVNIAEYMGDWRDVHVRCAGPVAEEMSKTFATMWEHTQKGVYLHQRPRFKKSIPPAFHRDWGVLTNAPRSGERHLYYALIEHIRQAKKYVYLTTPYFVPDNRFVRVLRLAAKRGVDVRLLVPHTVNHLLLTSANNFYFSRLLKSGVNIFRYKGPTLHSKTVVIDDEWVFVGTFNLDSLSFVWNYEVSVRSKDESLITTIRQQFFEDMRSSESTDYKTWHRRWFWQKCQEWCTWPFHKFL